MIGFDTKDVRKAILNNSPTLVALLVVWINLSNKITALELSAESEKSQQAELVKTSDKNSAAINVLEKKVARIQGILGDAYIRENKDVEDESEI